MSRVPTNSSHGRVPSKVAAKANTVREVVEYYLRRFPRTRDNDKLLQAYIWHYEMQKKRIPETEFLKHYAKGVFTDSETIRRNRQKAQEEVPELRGEVYEQRHGDKQEEWRETYGKKR